MYRVTIRYEGGGEADGRWGAYEISTNGGSGRPREGLDEGFGEGDGERAIGMGAGLGCSRSQVRIAQGQVGGAQRIVGSVGVAQPEGSRGTSGRFACTHHRLRLSTFIALQRIFTRSRSWAQPHLMSTMPHWCHMQATASMQ